ncbi:hypothetical protein IW147_006140 [Coemansia sp. RSA 720]|nr:hypothetical protein IW147_006140 [Coemansia sp. RSA 720]
MAPAEDEDETVDWAEFSYGSYKSRETESTHEDSDIDELPMENITSDADLVIFISSNYKSVVVYHSDNMDRVDALADTFSQVSGIPVGVVNTNDVSTSHIFNTNNDVFVECYDMCERTHNYKVE